MPTLEDDGFILWEANAILFYLASKRPERGLWPIDLGLPIGRFHEIGRCYQSLSALPAWRGALAAKDAAAAALFAAKQQETLR